ncbi:50S ribosomal protein L19 [Candidatus Uhrbacteria bacterium]|nr:50S ribosomal protein L19 [Candidatus Uhrbacteria bacterium]
MTDEIREDNQAPEVKKSEAESLTGIKGRLVKPSEVRPGATIRVHQKITETNPKGEEKERIQVYEGIVLGLRGEGVSRTMTVRKISGGIGVEKIFPLALPSIVALELLKVARVRRAKLGHLRTSKKRLRERAVNA